MTNLSPEARRLLDENQNKMVTVQMSKSDLALIGAGLGTALFADIIPDDSKDETVKAVERLFEACGKSGVAVGRILGALGKTRH